MATNFKQGFTNIGDGKEHPIGDIIKIPFAGRNQEYFDDFHSYDTRFYEKGDIGASNTAAQVVGEANGVIRLTTDASGSSATCLAWKAGEAAKVGNWNTIVNGETNFVFKYRFKMNHDAAGTGNKNTEGYPVIGLILPTQTANSFPFLAFTGQFTGVAHNKNSATVYGNTAFAGNLGSTDGFYSPAMDDVGDGNYHTLSIIYRDAKPGTGLVGKNISNPSGTAKEMVWMYDNQIIQTLDSISGRIPFDVGWSGISEANPAIGTPGATLNVGENNGFSPWFGIANGTGAVAQSMDVDYVYLAAEKPKGSY
jgi:hypothetical protein